MNASAPEPGKSMGAMASSAIPRLDRKVPYTLAPKPGGTMIGVGREFRRLLV